MPRQAARAMMRAPTRAAIYAAELRVAQAKQSTRDSLCRARSALRATLARPSTLALVAGTAGVLGFLLVRLRPRPVESQAVGPGTARTTSTAGLALTLLLQYGMRGLPIVWQRVIDSLPQRADRARAARPERATGVGADVSKQAAD
jgi:hypothetical protein